MSTIRKACLGIVAAAATVATLMAPAPAQAAPASAVDTAQASARAPGPECHIAHSKDRKTFDMNRNRNVHVSSRITFKQCRGRTGKYWVEPRSQRVIADWEGRQHLNCNPPGINFWQGVTWDSFFWDGTGRRYNPSGFKTACPSDGYTEVTRSLLHSPIMLFCDGPPKWKTEVTLNLGLEDDRELTLRRLMWDVFGPVPNRC